MSQINKKSSQSPNNKFTFAFGVVFVGAVLRIPFTAIPPVLQDIASSLHVPVASLGLLTTLPLLMFAIFSAVAAKLAQKTGIERLFAIVLALMVIGSFIRIFNLPLLFVGTLIIGAAIAILNVLLPSAILANTPTKIGSYTTLYSTVMAIASAIASSLAVPIVMASSWRGLILVLTAILVVALLIWLPNINNNHYLEARVKSDIDSERRHQSIWKNKLAWAFLVFCGLQSLLFYTGLTWLPTMSIDYGLAPGAAGLNAGLYSLIGLPVSLFVPILIERTSLVRHRQIMGLFSLAGIVGILMLFLHTGDFVWWMTINLLIGLAVGALFPYLLTTYSLKTSNPTDTAELSGMTQTGGYLIAAFGPYLFGFIHQMTGSWVPSIILILISTIVMTIMMFYVEYFEKIVGEQY